MHLVIESFELQVKFGFSKIEKTGFILSSSFMVWGLAWCVQWLGLHASTAGGVGSIPGWGTKILHAVWHGAYPPSKIKTPKT